MRSALVGRDAELAALCGELGAALAGRPRVVLCRGEPGIGKTRLAEELSDVARERGIAVAWGNCIDTAGAPPYWGWTQVLRAVSRGVDLASLAAEHGLTADLARLAPDVFVVPQPSPSTVTGADRFRQFDAVGRLLGQVTLRQPLVVVLDDVHWADRPSVLLLRHLARTVSNERLLLVVSFRTTENAHATDFAELVREPVTRQVELSGLPASAVAQQLAAITGQQVDSAEATQVHALTGGNPFFVTEVGRLLPARRVGGVVTPVSSNVREAIAARLHRLSSACVQLLRAASIVGRDFAVTPVAAMVDRAPGDCLEPLDEARAAGLIEAGELPGEHRFVHALIRDAIEAGLASGERVRLHRLAAGIIEERGADPLESQLFDLARHWAIAAVQGERLKATTWIERAADEAMHGLAYEEGARWFRLALSVGRGALDAAAECRLMLGLARALHLSGDGAGCLDACVAAAGLAGDLGRADLLAEAALAAEAVGPSVTELTRQQLCREALAALPTDQLALRARVTARLAEACIYVAWLKDDTLDDYEAARVASEHALALAEQCDDRAALEAALRARRMACSAPEGLDERERLAERMLVLGRASADARSQLWARLWRIDVAFERGDLPRVTRELEALSWCVQEVRGPHPRFELLRCQAVLAQAQARFGDAMRLAAAAFAEVGLAGDELGYQERAGLLHQIGLHIGHQASGSVEASGFADATVFDRELQTAGVIVAVANAHMLASVGRLEEARAVYRSLGPPAEWQPSPHAVLPALAFGINLAIALGADDDVDTLRERLDRYRGHHVVAEPVRSPTSGRSRCGWGRSAHLGLLDEAITDLQPGRGDLRRERSRGIPGGGPVPSRVRAGPAGTAGDSTRARALLESTVRQASALADGPVQARADALLRQLVAAGPLTRREWEVAELVAQGSTNREIAAQLCLSERTAQNHVQHILTKLDLANRSQITAWVARQDLSTRAE